MAPHDTKVAPRDPFTESLQGPTVRVVINSNTSIGAPEVFHLPQCLLSKDSHFFRYELSRLTKIATVNQTSDDFTASASPKTDASTTSTTSTTAARVETDVTPYSYIPIITLYDVDSVVFGLYLRFLYQGTWPSKSGFTAVWGPGSTNTSDPADTLAASASAAFTSTPMNFVPLHFRAWIFGSQIRATRFQNHAIDHIYRGIGTQFYLTPHLVGWVWAHTTNSFNSPQQNHLRALTLDILISHWRSSTNHVCSLPALKPLWNHLFNTYEDLRQDFIFGLQGRRVLPCNSYWIQEDGNRNGTRHVPVVSGGQVNICVKSKGILKKECGNSNTNRRNKTVVSETNVGTEDQDQGQITFAQYPQHQDYQRQRIAQVDQALTPGAGPNAPGQVPRPLPFREYGVNSITPSIIAPESAAAVAVSDQAPVLLAPAPSCRPAKARLSSPETRPSVALSSTSSPTLKSSSTIPQKRLASPTPVEDANHVKIAKVDTNEAKDVKTAKVDVDQKIPVKEEIQEIHGE